MIKLEDRLRESLEAVNQRVDAALREALRNRSGLTVIAVTKRQPVEVLRAAYALGLRDFGESQIQEGVLKVKALPDDIVWHFIGHLQKNKVRKAVLGFDYIHGIDSLPLLQRVDAIAAQERLCPKVFLQVNYALDSDKHGLHPDAVAPVLEAALTLENTACIGLMGIPPLSANDAKTTAYFKGMAALRDRLKETFPDWPGKLSLGMSADFEAAIAAGSNFIRVGTALLGERT
jgi:hypothetical protein